MLDMMDTQLTQTSKSCRRGNFHVQDLDRLSPTENGRLEL